MDTNMSERCSTSGSVKSHESDRTVALLKPSRSRTSSASSIGPGSEGFKGRKVELKDGYLIVSEENSTCTSVMGNTMDGWENVYVEHRDDIINKVGFISTPLHVVKMLAENMKQEIHIEHYILKGPLNENKIIYRVDILFGPIRGVGQCIRKQLARQLAAIDVYEKIQLQQGDIGFRPTPIPRCALLPGWRIEELIYPELFHNICQSKNLEKPKFKMILPSERKLGKFTAICRVGKMETKGENDHPWLAKKIAAKEMYEMITGNEFPLRGTIMGNEVIGIPEMKLLGFEPKITNLKRKWTMEHRIQDTQVVHLPNEPDDGEMVEIEEEAQMRQSKRLKLAELKETLKITLPRNSDFRKVTATTSTSVSTLKVPQTSPRFIEASQFEPIDDEDELVINIEDSEMLE